MFTTYCRCPCQALRQGRCLCSITEQLGEYCNPEAFLGGTLILNESRVIRCISTLQLQIAAAASDGLCCNYAFDTLKFSSYLSNMNQNT